MLVDLYLVYQFIRRLATPFKEWEAYKLGIIDENGNRLKKRRDLESRDEKRAWGIFDLMVCKMKQLLEKLPGGATRIASYAAALWLIKEHNMFTDSESLLTESTSEATLNESLFRFRQHMLDYTTYEASVNNLVEEGVPANNVGGGAIVGLGIGQDGEPGVSRLAQRRIRKRNRKGFKAYRNGG